MQNGKIDSQLLLAVELPEAERERTTELNVGYVPEEKSWELLVKSVGDLTETLQNFSIAPPIRLLNGYSVLVVPETRLAQLSELPEIEYIEKPKRLYFEVENGIAASCILSLQRSGRFPEGNLSGKGVIVAVIDSGIDIAHPDFRNPDGSTRIIGLWDLSLDSDIENPPPTGYERGRFYSEEDINLILRSEQVLLPLSLPGADRSGHGTAVAGIACGNGRALRENMDQEDAATLERNRYRGVAYESDILVVKLGGTDIEARTTQLMLGVDYCIREAARRLQPVAINLSFGNNYGAHNGASLVERYLFSAADAWKTSIVIGSGNEGSAAHHAAGKFLPGDTGFQIHEWVVDRGEQEMSLQIWLSYLDEVEVSIIAPSGAEFRVSNGLSTAQAAVLDGTRVYAYLGEPKPYDGNLEYTFEFVPDNETIAPGIWRARITPLTIRNGQYDLWLPSSEAVGNAVRFLRPDPDTTLTIPSTVRSGITVGAYNVATDSVAFFSGRGYLPDGCTVKPDLVAPGVNIYTAAPGGSYSRKSGTSFAAPFVTGSAALLMQWGIVWGRDVYLYGEKLKANLLRGARTLPGATVPSTESGWGALCVNDSLPE